MSPQTERYLPHDGKLLLEAVVGSTAYGLATKSSDVDMLGVYIASTPHVFGLQGPDVVRNSVVTTEPDTTYHEIGKFFSLALKGNPTILELLFLSPEQSSEIGERIIQNRTYFLGANNIRNAYGGYATQQAKRLLSRHKEGKIGFNSDLAKRTAKHGRHCYRLLILGRQLLTQGFMDLDLSSMREEIFAVGDQAVSDPEAFNRFFENERAKLDSVTPVIADEPDRAMIDNLLISSRFSLTALI